ncbi:hypothetical protein N0V90_003631 [Kalmusia sp. IMI 367209]|nr:hypothetical protein N0V90_003631 [Kalmusia sp. IMI 367209]
MSDVDSGDEDMIGTQSSGNSDTQLNEDDDTQPFESSGTELAEGDTQMIQNVDEGDLDPEGERIRESIEERSVYEVDGVDESELPDAAQILNTENHMDLNHRDEGAQEVLSDIDAINGLEVEAPQHRIDFEEIQDSQYGQQDRGVTTSEVRETPDHDDQSLTVHPQDNKINNEQQSLFIPYERYSSSTPGISRETSSILTPSLRLTETPEPSTRRSSSRMLPPPLPTSRTTTQPSGSRFAMLRKFQKKFNQDKVAASRPTYHVQPAPDSEQLLESILLPTTRRPAPTDISTVDDYDRADREALAAYQKQKRKYDALKQKKGRLSFREDVEWMKIHGAERMRREKRKRDLEMARDDDREPDLFPDPFRSRDEQEDNGANEDRIDNDPAGSFRNPHKRISIQEAELQSMEVALQADKDLPRKKRKGDHTTDETQSSSSGKSRGRPKGSKPRAPAASSRSSGTRAKAGGHKPSAKDKKEMERAVRLGTSLLNSNVFRNQAQGDAPERHFTSRNKQDALKELIASVPIENQKSAKDDRAALMRAIKDFDGRGSVKAHTDSMWLVKDMASSLKSYQIMGTAFMRNREKASEEPRGGLMADAMGLGKTLMMLANIVNGRPGKYAECKTTLLVASPALITQWGREIELHTNAGLVVMRYTTGSRIDSNRADDILRRHDIILTTYHEIMKSYPKNEPPIECQTAEQKIAWWKDVYEKNRGPLHRMMVCSVKILMFHPRLPPLQFHRIVLDEAQAIKNHTSRTSIACRALMAHHKWALSGTPILNSLDELYPYFKFLGVPHTGNFKVFKHNYTDPNDSENSERLLVRLSQFMIRRDHSDILFDAPILKLPEASQMTHWCEFNSVERSIYEIVRQRFAKRINFSSNKGELEKSYSNALVMLLRLRQLTAHILMLQFVVQDLLEREDIEKIRETVQHEATDRHSRRGATIRAIRKQLDHLAAQEMKRSAQKAAKDSKGLKDPLIVEEEIDEEVPDIEALVNDDDNDQELDDDDTQNGQGQRNSSGRTFGKNFDFRPYLNSLTSGDSWEKVKRKARCSGCDKRPRGPWITSCGHLLCSSCYDGSQIRAAEEERTNATCRGCGSVFTHANEIPEDEVESLVYHGPETRAKKKQHAEVVRRIEQQDIAGEWLQMGGEGVLPSAKTIAVKAQIMNWIRILKKVCQEERWGAEEYHGKMSQPARDIAIKRFADDKVGLNLTMASRVVILDPWWNSAAEQQAFCRVFRYGQTEKTSLTRFCVKNTVDERLIQMQEKKQKEIDSVMKDDGSKVKKMSIRDLMRLFGNLQEDNNGRPFILIDNPDPRGGFRADRDHEGYADEI